MKERTLSNFLSAVVPLSVHSLCSLMAEQRVYHIARRHVRAASSELTPRERILADSSLTDNQKATRIAELDRIEVVAKLEATREIARRAASAARASQKRLNPGELAEGAVVDHERFNPLTDEEREIDEKYKLGRQHRFEIAQQRRLVELTKVIGEAALQGAATADIERGQALVTLLRNNGEAANKAEQELCELFGVDAIGSPLQAVEQAGSPEPAAAATPKLPPDELAVLNYLGEKEYYLALAAAKAHEEGSGQRRASGKGARKESEPTVDLVAARIAANPQWITQYNLLVQSLEKERAENHLTPLSEAAKERIRSRLIGDRSRGEEIGFDNSLLGQFAIWGSREVTVPAPRAPAASSAAAIAAAGSRAASAVSAAAESSADSASQTPEPLIEGTHRGSAAAVNSSPEF